MTQPHHHVFNALQQSIIKGVDVKAILQHLVRKGVIPESHKSRYETRSGMKILIGYLRNRSFEDFLLFVECIFLTQQQDPSKSKGSTVIESIIRAVQDFDQRKNTSYTERVVAIQLQYLSKEASAPVAEAGADLSERLAEMSMTLRKPLEVLPRGLVYVGEPVVRTFDCDGGILDMPKYGFSIQVPEGAVMHGHHITVNAAICVCGPFSISERYRIASDFVVIIADGKFELPVKIHMEHCMIMSEYRKSSDVVILKADHCSVTEDGLYTFDDFVNPEVSSSHSTISFEMQSFCVLCDAIRVDKFRTPSHPSIDDDNLSSAQSSFEESGEYPSSSPIKSSPGNLEAKGHDLSSASGAESSEPERRPVLGKRKLALHQKLPEQRKIRRSCQPEYCALFCEPSKPLITIRSKYYMFVVFITLNCPGNVQLCKDRAQRILKTTVDIKTIPIEFFSESKPLVMEIENMNSSWMIEPDKTPTISLKEVQFHLMNARDLAQRIAQETCPPRIVYEADYTEDGIARLNCKIRIHGATIATTDQSVFFRISVRPPVLEPSLSSLHRQKAVDVSGSVSGRHGSFDKESVSSWVFQSPSHLSYGHSPQMEYRPFNYERTISGGSSSSLTINIYCSDSETERDGKPMLPLSEYKRGLDDILSVVLRHADVRLIITDNCKNWKHMARCALKLDDATIHQVDHDYSRDGFKECCIQAYEIWRKRQTSTDISIETALDMFYAAGEPQIMDALVERGKQRKIL